MNLRKVSTKELVEELSNREGVEDIGVGPHQEYRLETQANEDYDAVNKEDSGPATILVVID